MPRATTRGEAPLDTEPPSVERSADPLVGRPPNRLDAGVASLVALVTMVVAVVWRSPIVPTDPWHYVQSAESFPKDDWIPLGFTRYGVVLPNALPLKLFGDAEATYYFWTVLCAGLLAAVVYLLGRRWWGPMAGVVSVVVLFTNSIVFYNLTRQYPDLMSMAFVFSAAFCALMARDRDFRGRAAVAWLLATGFFLGWSFETRETALFAWPIVLVLLWRRGTVLRTLTVTAVPVLGWALLDVLVSGIVHGDPLLKARVLTGFGAGRAPVDAEEAATVASNTRWDWFLAIPKHAIETRPDGWWMVATGILAVLVLLVRNWPLRLVSASFLSIYAVNLLAGGLLFPDKPFGDLYNIRYWIQYIPSLALVVGGTAGLAGAWLARRVAAENRGARVGAAALVGALACAVPLYATVTSVPTIPAFAVNGGDALGDLRDHLAEIDYTTHDVWTDVRTYRLLPIYQRPAFGGDKVWTGTPKRLGKDEGGPRSGDSVLLYSAYDDTCFHCQIQIDPWLQAHPVPDSWELVYETPSRNVQLYRVP